MLSHHLLDVPLADEWTSCANAVNSLLDWNPEFLLGVEKVVSILRTCRVFECLIADEVGVKLWMIATGSCISVA